MNKLYSGILGSVRPLRDKDFFVSIWKTDNTGTSADDEITLPLTTGPNNFDVFWGDGTVDYGVTQTTPLTHPYPSAGIYTLRIRGSITGFRFANGGDKEKILNISQWGVLRIGNLGSQFRGCINLTITATDTLDLTGTTFLSSTFHTCSSLTTIPNFNLWDDSLITSIANIMQNAAFDGPVPDFNSVVNANSAFVGCPINQSMSGKFLNVTSATGFLNNADSFNSEPPAFDLVTSFNSTYANMAVFNQPVTIEIATLANNMFQNALSFNSVITVNSQLTNISAMLQNTSFDQDISAWDVSQLTTATNFLAGCTLSTVNYDALLIAWEAQSVQNNVTIHFGSSQYTSGGASETARTNLINDHSWSITDGGSV